MKKTLPSQETATSCHWNVKTRQNIWSYVRKSSNSCGKIVHPPLSVLTFMFNRAMIPQKIYLHYMDISFWYERQISTFYQTRYLWAPYTPKTSNRPFAELLYAILSLVTCDFSSRLFKIFLTCYHHKVCELPPQYYSICELFTIWLVTLWA